MSKLNVPVDTDSQMLPYIRTTQRALNGSAAQAVPYASDTRH